MTIRTDSKQGLPQPGLDAAREGRAFFGYVNEKASLNSEAVLTDATFLRAIELGKRLVIQSFYAHLSTANDTAKIKFVTTENADGSGDDTAQSVQYHIETGAEFMGADAQEMGLDVPIVVTRDDGQAFSAKVVTNDAGATLTLGYRGWEEDDD